ncbi:PadR family transcriptional regulator [Ornithinimicrobium sp. Y1847]|uniref:PadR family transcriptional regulator n=1 Tax=Ornithinimicrobium sp. Y1847 TaxID=3405419 RepID=UPI003B66ED00
MTTEDPLPIHAQELRRGTAVVAVLALLDEPRYGYALLEELAAAGVEVEGNTLYPLLRRLEKQGLLTSEWNTEESRPRKFYALTDQGRGALGALAAEWRSIRSSLDRLLRKATS